MREKERERERTRFAERESGVRKGKSCALREAGRAACVCVVSSSSLGIKQLLYKLTNMEFNSRIAQAIREIQRGETTIRYVSGLKRCLNALLGFHIYSQ